MAGVPCLTIGMATYKDFDGVYFTVQALRLYHDMNGVELVVVDNFGCPETKKFCEQVGVKYFRYDGPSGTGGPRDFIFRVATAKFVLVLDCHVLVAGTGAMGSISRLKQYYAAHPNTNDLIQGPLLYDQLQSVSTHFEPIWNEHMWGVWSTANQTLSPDALPFEIPMQGLGLFSCRKEAWPGFSPKFRGFGGEEGYIHEKFRLRGGKCLCLPWLRWVHRFGRPNGVFYPLKLEDRVFNYLVGHAELGLPLEPIFGHFRRWLPDAILVALANEAGVSPPSGFSFGQAGPVVSAGLVPNAR